MTNSLKEKNKMRLIDTHCPLCGSMEKKTVDQVYLSPVRVLTQLVECRKCRQNYVSPRPDADSENAFYVQQYHAREPIEMWRDHRQDFFAAALNHMEQRTHERRLLDVGCGAGFFMQIAESRGWNTAGVDLSEDAVRYAQETLKLKVIKGVLSDLVKNSTRYPVVTLWNVLDQMTDPLQELKSISVLTEKEGLLALRISNLNCHLAIHRIWRGLTRLKLVDREKIEPTVFHLQMFNPRSVKKFLEVAGFEVITMTNAVLDPNPADLSVHFGRSLSRYLRNLYFSFAEAVRILTLGVILIGPSLFVIARRR